MASEDNVAAHVRAHNATWDPTQKGIVVRLLGNPGRQGTTTGRSRRAGGFLLVEVDFGPNEREYRRAELLEPVETDADMVALMASGRFGGPIDLRRVLIFEKIKGDLTNIFYSMEASNTDFYPHQFKPVLKFIESPVGRFLIADEVGLGKTIESIYIWKELHKLERRPGASSLCAPRCLRDKWRSDLAQRFNIDADILSARELLHRAGILPNPTNPLQGRICAAHCRLDGHPGQRWISRLSALAGTSAELPRPSDSHGQGLGGAPRGRDCRLWTTRARN